MPSTAFRAGRLWYIPAGTHREGPAMSARTKAHLMAENRTLRARLQALERKEAGRRRPKAGVDHAARPRALAEASLRIDLPLSIDEVLRVVTEEARRVTRRVLQSCAAR